MAGSWKQAIPPDEWELYRKAGFGEPAELGRTPALLIIDVQYRTVGREPMPIRESILRHYPTSCGERGWQAVAAISKLATAARLAGVPIIYPHVVPRRAADRERMSAKIPALLKVSQDGYAFVHEIEPRADDLLIPKRHSSAFFGTPLASHLIGMAVDTVLLTGCTTSGCIRATAIDACAYNFACAVIEDCVYDRSLVSHDVNLFDINAKYGNVTTLDDTLAYLVSVTPTGSAAAASGGVSDEGLSGAGAEKRAAEMRDSA